MVAFFSTEKECAADDLSCCTVSKPDCYKSVYETKTEETTISENQVNRECGISQYFDNLT